MRLSRAAFLSLSGNMSRFIGTHNGKFHCDEVFACWMLKQLPQFKHHEILRTRDLAKLDRCDIVVDVGAVFDHEKKRYDHHQRSFTETMASLAVIFNNGKLICRKSLQYNTKLSSAGLIYAFYGQEVLKTLLAVEGFADVNSSTIDFYFNHLYKHFVESVDAVDNGINAHDEPPKYVIPVSLQGIVADLNPSWDDEKADENTQFEKAMAVVGDIFKDKLLYIHKSWMPARVIVEKAVAEREQVHPSGKVIIFDTCVPWKQHFFMIEEELQIGGHIVFALFPGDKNGTNWRIQSIPVSQVSEFENRWPLPEKWRGLRDDDLAKAIDVPSAIFVHGNGFIGGAKTREDVIEMANKALRLPRTA